MSARLMTATSSIGPPSNTTSRTPQRHVAPSDQDVWTQLLIAGSPLGPSPSTADHRQRAVSESGATDHMGRRTLARSRHLAACNNIPKHADARRISVHTEELRADLRSTVPPADLARDAPGWAREWWITRWRGSPVLSLPRV
jgi:hypothetical protein